MISEQGSALLTTAGPEYIENVLPALLAWRHAGRPGALVTLIGVDGSSPRPLGSQMAVSIEGDFTGHITAGCAEVSIASEAVSLIKAKKNGTVRYGSGSRFIDIRLPCGSGIDVYFDTRIATGTLEKLHDSICARRPVILRTDTTGHTSEIIDIAAPRDERKHRTRREGDNFLRYFEPAIRVLVIGKGPYVGSLARLANELGWEVIAVSPEIETLRHVEPVCIKTHHLTRPEDFDPTLIDAWTASVLLFHDHEWESPILQKILDREGFYVGAMGARRTHEQRAALLETLGCNETRIQDIHAPVGLDIGARNPPEIALSVLAEILERSRYSNDG